MSEFEEGDLVVPCLLPSCEDCVDCKSERSNLCSKLPFSPLNTGMPRDGVGRLSTAAGERLHHFFGVSSFVEYTVVDVTNLVKVDPAHIPPERACLLGCGISTGTYLFLSPIKPSTRASLYPLSVAEPTHLLEHSSSILDRVRCSLEGCRRGEGI